MFLKKKLKATEDCLPLYPPKLPTIEELRASDTPQKDVEEYFKNCEEASKKTEENFKNALKRIKLCDYLYGMSHFHFYTPHNIYERKHFKWCPQSEWNEYNKFMENNPLNIQR